MSKLTDPFTQLDDKNLNCYQTAGAIGARVLDQVVKACVVGAKLAELCELGDRLILEEVAKIHKKIKCKGIAFPTCISVDQVAGQYNNPAPEELIREGDLVKIELGVQMNGFPATVCYTVLVRESSDSVDDKKTRVLKAASEASKEILKTLKPGNTNTDIKKILEKYADKYNCSLPYTNNEMHSPGTSSFQMSQHVIDGFNDETDEFIHAMIIQRECDNYEFTQVEQELEENEVYSIDVLMSSGSGKLTELEDKPCTIFKRNQDKKVMLKMKASKETLNHFGDSRFPVSTKAEATKFKFGLKECIGKGLVEPYPPMTEKKDEVVARIKFTAIVRKKPLIILGRSADEQLDKLK